LGDEGRGSLIKFKRKKKGDRGNQMRHEEEEGVVYLNDAKRCGKGINEIRKSP